MAALRALIAVLLVPALGAGVSIAVLHSMAAYTGAGLADVRAACAPEQVVLFLSRECDPVQAHYWLLLLCAAAAAAGLALVLLRLIGGRTDFSLFSIRGLLGAPIVTAQWVILAAAAYLAEAQWFDRVPARVLLPAAVLGAGLVLLLLVNLLRLRADD
jgi:hypothetical protein